MPRCRRRWRPGAPDLLRVDGGERDVETLDLEDLAGRDPALDDLRPHQREDSAVGEDRSRIAVPVDARHLALVARHAVLVRFAVGTFVDIIEAARQLTQRAQRPAPAEAQETEIGGSAAPMLAAGVGHA